VESVSQYRTEPAEIETAIRLADQLDRTALRLGAAAEAAKTQRGRFQQRVTLQHRTVACYTAVDEILDALPLPIKPKGCIGRIHPKERVLLHFTARPCPACEEGTV